jgi:hypothetical protein
MGGSWHSSFMKGRELLIGRPGRRAEAIGHTLAEGNDRATGVLLELVANVTGVTPHAAISAGSARAKPRR